MVQLAVQVSKYLMILLFLGYTFECFHAFADKSGQKRGRGCTVQRVLLFLIHFDAFLVLYLTTEDLRVIGFYLMQVVLFAMFFTSCHLFYKQASELVLNNMCMLLAVGFIMLTRISFEQAFRQFLFVCAGFVVSLLIPVALTKLSLFCRLTWLYAVAGIGALAVVAVAGASSYGAKLSISIGPVSVQPSEFVKIIFVLFIASMLYRKNDLRQVGITSAVSAVFVLMLVASKDLGGALIYFFAYLIMIYVATRRATYFGAGLCLLAAASVAGYYLFSHVQTRVAAWADPLSVIDNQGYQICQSLFAIGTGGWFGLGLGQGNPGKIPVVAKDFIFSAISEELGGLFALALIMVCVSCFFMIMNVAMRIGDSFCRLTAVGLGALYALQVFLTIGGVVKFIPSTGVTLPLVSYGGSSLLSTLILFGMVQGLYIVSGGVPEEGAGAGAKGRGAKSRKQAAAQAGNRRAGAQNREILVVMYLFLALFLGMTAYFVFFQVFKSEEFINSPYNSLQDLFAEQVVRGDITSADGHVLATTKTDGEGNETREYPYGRMFAHAVGYAVNGKAGIENQENFELLRSHEFFLKQLADDLQGAKSQGDTVVTTLDYGIQERAYEALGGCDGAVIAMEPKTGKILAMVSMPDYDPNRVAENWENITADGSTVLYNRATQGKYAPGSIFKIFTTLEYYREHPKGYKKYNFDCLGEITEDGQTIHCASNKKHGKEDLKSSFANSCNSSYAKLSLSLDADRFSELCGEMLFNQDLPIAFESGRSSFHLSDTDTSALVMETGIGQGKTMVSPLHMLLVASAIANDGVLMRPYLTERTQNASGIEVSANEPTEYGELMSGKEAALLQEYMRSVVTDGTGSKLAGQSYTAYGKTGTAQVSDSSDRTNAWFIGYAAKEGYEDLAIAVVVEGSGAGSTHAVPIAKRVFDLYFNR